MSNCYCIVFKYFSIWILLAGSVHSDVLLVEEGVPRAVIVLPDIPAEEEQLAAEEFIEHIKNISGAELSILNEPHGIPDSMIPIFIGTAAEEALVQPLSTTEDNYSSFVLEVKKVLVYRFKNCCWQKRTESGTMRASWTRHESLPIARIAGRCLSNSKRLSTYCMRGSSNSSSAWKRSSVKASVRLLRFGRS